MYVPAHEVGDVVVIPECHGRHSGMLGRVVGIRRSDGGIFYDIDVSTSAIYDRVPVHAASLDSIND